jgi:hypothetical protein
LYFFSQVTLLVRPIVRVVVLVLVGKVWDRVLVRQGWVRGRVGLYRFAGVLGRWKKVLRLQVKMARGFLATHQNRAVIILSQFFN